MAAAGLFGDTVGMSMGGMDTGQRTDGGQMQGEPLDTIEWTIAAGLDGLDEYKLLAGFCERLVRLGLPLQRASIAANLLHPVYGSRSLRWRSGEVEQFRFERAA